MRKSFKKILAVFNDKGDYVMQASKNGSIIKVNSDEYNVVIDSLTNSNTEQE